MLEAKLGDDLNIPVQQPKTCAELSEKGIQKQSSRRGLQKRSS